MAERKKRTSHTLAALEKQIASDKARDEAEPLEALIGVIQPLIAKEEKNDDEADKPAEG